MTRQIVLLAFAPLALSAATNVSGTITSNTTWDASGNPYIVSGVSVASGVTLTIAAGAIVKLSSIVPLNVQGALVVNGTAAQPVVFTSSKDDSVGGDTNGDGSASKPAAGDWGSIWLRGSACSLNYAIVRYEGAYISPQGSQYTMVSLGTSGTSAVTNSTFSDSSNTALYVLANVQANISGSTFARNQTSLAIASGGSTHVHDSSFQLDSNYGVLNLSCPNSGSCSTPDVDATNNYWGSPSGPWLNPPKGPGDRVSYHVTYTPFIGSLSATGAPPPAQTLLGRPGSSTNAAGFTSEPINTATGNYYLTLRDISVPGKGTPFSFARSYNSQDSYSGPLGAGWTHSYNVTVTVDQTTGNVAIKEPDGHVDFYSPAGGGSYVPQIAGLFDKLQQNADSSVTLTRKNQIQLVFSPVGKLLSVTDPNGNTKLLSYDTSGNLTTVVDSSGRTFSFMYDGSGHLTSVSDPIGRSWQYTYDANGNLASVRDPLGGITQYSYDTNHRMT